MEGGVKSWDSSNELGTVFLLGGVSCTIFCLIRSALASHPLRSTALSVGAPIALNVDEHTLPS